MRALNQALEDFGVISIGSKACVEGFYNNNQVLAGKNFIFISFYDGNKGIIVLAVIVPLEDAVHCTSLFKMENTPMKQKMFVQMNRFG